ncbi:unnamed protein product [Leuciscus chuanchicus]
MTLKSSPLQRNLSLLTLKSMMMMTSSKIVCDSSECSALNSVMCDFHVNSLNFNVPQLPISAVSDCRVDVIQASDCPNEDTVDDGLQRDRASDNETKPDFRVPEDPVPANDTPDVLCKVLSSLSSQWMTLAMISFIFITIYLGLKALMMSVLSIQIKCFHQIIRIGYKVYHCYHMPWFRTLSWYFLLCVIYFFYGETKPYRQQFFACTHVILLNVAIHSNLIIQSPYGWKMWFIVPISCVIYNNIIAYVFGFFFGVSDKKKACSLPWKIFMDHLKKSILYQATLSGLAE